MKILRNILAILGGIATFVLAILGWRLFMDSEMAPGAHVQYYDNSGLTNMVLPQWSLTNAIPITPDQAIRAAFQYATEMHPGVIQWDTHRIELVKESKTAWAYHIFVSGMSPGNNLAEEDVSVLMNGQVWRPSAHKN
jgi:hypothetical protein